MKNRFAFCRAPRCMFVSIALALTLMAAAPLGAMEGVGTFYLGVKAWGALWDSPYIRIFAREIERAEQLANAGATSPYADNALWRYRTTYVSGRGYLAGPLASYQSPDRRWTVSIAVMWLSYFTAQYREKVIGDTKRANMRDLYPMSTATRVQLRRGEVDCALSYAINEYVKVFAGYKFQQSVARTSVNLVAARYNGDYRIMVHLPAAGVGMGYPVSSVLALSFQAGFLYSFPSLREFPFKTVSHVYPEPGFSVEAGVAIMPVAHLVIQVGYRVQVYGFRMRKANAAAATIAIEQPVYASSLLPVGLGYQQTYRELDLFHGLTLAVVAYF